MTDRPALPVGFRVALDPGVRRIDGGRVLVGGAPLRLLRVTSAGAGLLDRLASGAPVPSGSGGARLVRRLLDTGMAHPRLDHVDPPFGAGDVAAVIPIRGRTDQLAPTLAALGPVGEVVVVDDGSPAPVAVPDGVRVLRHERSRGPGPAREVGWRATDLPVVAFVDAEVVPAAGWLPALLAHLADPAVGAVAPRTVASGGPGRLAAYDADRSPLDLGPAEATVRPGSPVPYVPTTALVVRREAMAAVGGFDPDLRFGEDVDLVWRLVAAGWTVRYAPEVTVTHPVRPDGRGWVRQRFAYGSSAGPLAVRHGAAVVPLRLSGWSGAAWALAAVGHPGLGALVAAGSTAALARKLGGLDDPAGEALRLAGRGHLLAGRAIAQAVRRAWLPAAVAAAVASRRLRPAVATAVLGPAVVDLVRRGPVPAALHLADDAAYCAGVWAGSWRARTGRALLPASAGPVDPPT
ncbi:mycofactocin biosynthesis glycosyltransferase MftF [Iamia sp. SCSIO 61187]|uniref:mycofactocin biosynthesis glycosyltransferase MftF n=1 Tax=Iamia sp. SCSIO 61187 TaxID=2722752 RepID=UPI001C62A54F|nr:mycofactocin biosynthesis glycosyltransferase MftF [Iamia sp. SCSIO 61187]